MTPDQTLPEAFALTALALCGREHNLQFRIGSSMQRKREFHARAAALFTHPEARDPSLLEQREYQISLS